MLGACHGAVKRGVHRFFRDASCFCGFLCVVIDLCRCHG